MKLIKTGIILTVSFIIGYYLVNLITEPKADNPRSNMGLNSNTIHVGLLNEEGLIIDNGSKIEKYGDSLDYTISIDSYISQEREYMLLVLEDHKSIEFSVGNESPKDTYKFSLQPNESINIQTSVQVAKDSKEITYMIIKEPSTLFEPNEVNQEVMKKAISLENPMTLRFIINDNSKEFVYSDLYQEINEDPVIELFQSEVQNHLAPIFTIESGKQTYLTLGNTIAENIDIAIIQFLDWEQVPFENGEYVQYINAKPNKQYYKENIIPTTDVKSNYQIFAFYKPYQISNTEPESLQVFGTNRSVVKPK